MPLLKVEASRKRSYFVSRNQMADMFIKSLKGSYVGNICNKLDFWFDSSLCQCLDDQPGISNSPVKQSYLLQCLLHLNFNTSGQHTLVCNLIEVLNSRGTIQFGCTCTTLSTMTKTCNSDK